MDDQEKIKLEMFEDEIRERERQPRKSSLFSSLTTPQAIVFATVILLAGHWTMKTIDEYIKAKQIERVLLDFGQGLKRSTDQMAKESKARNERLRQQRIVREQKRLEQEQQRLEQINQAKSAAAQAKREEKLKSDPCQFWIGQNERESTTRTRAKVQEACYR